MIQKLADNVFKSGLNVLAFLMIFFLVPETKQYTLEELDYIFAIPTRRFMSYQKDVALPWFFRRYILCDKEAKLAPLYQLDQSVPEVASAKV